MASTSHAQVGNLVVFLCILIPASITSSNDGSTAKGLCHTNEREALLKFGRKYLSYVSKGNHLGMDDDCCSWAGVVCDNATGHVVKLDLSWACINGTVPHRLGNLSSLRYLDLSNSLCRVEADSLHWLSHLSSLEHLGLSGVNLRRATNWLKEINMLPSLTDLTLSGCELPNLPTTLPSLNFTSLTSLDLSSNKFISKLPDWLVDLHNLVDLNLVKSSLFGEIPNGLGYLCNLKTFNVAHNNMDGELHEFFESLSTCGGVFSTIETLDLSCNNFSGPLPESLGELSGLIKLDLSKNLLGGVLSEAHLANLGKLESLNMSSNSFRLIVSPSWVPPFQLKDILLRSCKLGPQFPMWLQYQKDYLKLDLSDANISDTVPTWFWNLSSQAVYLNMSRNQLSGMHPYSLRFSMSAKVDLSSNRFDGPLPKYITNATILNLSNNSFSGPIPSTVCTLQLIVLDLSKNNLTGQIPPCSIDTQWWVLDLSNNQLSGNLSSVFSNFQLTWLQLSHNNFSGTLPSSGVIPPHLVCIDLSFNRLSGTIPEWIGEQLSYLRILKLRSNMLCGYIPSQLLFLSSLRILDLADNQLSGNVPSSFVGFLAMRSDRVADIVYKRETTRDSYDAHMDVVMKGAVLRYTTTLKLVTAMDVSNNNLSGEIPRELTRLYVLKSLNLSGNRFEGGIPEDVGNMTSLLSLDLSRNQLSGTIPSSLASLTFLSSLNLSFNNLSGEIPQGNQLQTFTDPSIYAGNQGLSGFPLTEMRPRDKDPHATDQETSGGKVQEDTREHLWFYASLAFGFVIGFWSMFGSLILNKSWRIKYYRLLDSMGEWLLARV